MSDLGLYFRAVLALVVVLALIGLAAFLLRRFGSDRFKVTRGKRRLDIVEVASVDARRRLVLVKRDATEHLLLIGGPNDVLIETGIPVAQAAAALASSAIVAETVSDRRTPTFKGGL